MSKIDLPPWYVGKEDFEAEGKEISVLDEPSTKEVLPLEDIKPDAPVAPKSRLGPLPDFLKKSFEAKEAKKTRTRRRVTTRRRTTSRKAQKEAQKEAQKKAQKEAQTFTKSCSRKPTCSQVLLSHRQ